MLCDLISHLVSVAVLCRSWNNGMQHVQTQLRRLAWPLSIKVFIISARHDKDLDENNPPPKKKQKKKHTAV